jgi:hypothetical protein
VGGQAPARTGLAAAHSHLRQKAPRRYVRSADPSNALHLPVVMVPKPVLAVSNVCVCHNGSRISGPLSHRRLSRLKLLLINKLRHVLWLPSGSPRGTMIAQSKSI